MLELKNIVKDYVSGNNVTHALKGISVNFRKNEFVSILGASGCGKTTTLNIIGGLDRYTSGDLIINGKSTKNYTDRDWDTYRNHSIGFIFQSYNLISHQNILKNVELALTISGVDKEERKARAMKALATVGLAGMEKKKPNQLSGGQCQRVAIARALINNPEILLADEPTGALDSETSVQIMDLLKEVAKDRLVIMVTHNPDLAKKYSTRIITMSDGVLLKDSKPFDGKEKAIEEVSKGKKKKSSMSLWTSAGLSVSNLFSKIKRTVLVTIAGSIGIIGVSAVLAVSQGVKDYIGDLQNDMLSSYPLRIAEESVDYTSLMSGLSVSDVKDQFEFDPNNPKVGIDSMINYLMSAYSDITKVKTNTIDDTLMEYIEGVPTSALSAKYYNYGIDVTNNIFGTWKQDKDDQGKLTSLNGLTQSYIKELTTVEGFEQYASYVNLFTNFMDQMPDSKEYILDQYDVLAGEFSTGQNDLTLVVDSNTTLTDLLLAETGIFNHDEFLALATKAIAVADIQSSDMSVADKKDALDDIEEDPKYDYTQNFSFDELINREFTYYPSNTIYKFNPKVAEAETTVSYIAVLNDGEGKFESVFYLTYVEEKDMLMGIMLYSVDGESKTPTVVLTRAGAKPDNPAEPEDILNGSWVGSPLNGLVPDTTKLFNINIDNAGNDTFCYLNPETYLPLGMPRAFSSTKASSNTEQIQGYSYPAVVDSGWENGTTMKITSILRLKDSKNFGCLSRGLYYSKSFADKYIADSENAAITNAMKNQIKTEAIAGTATEFKAYVTFNYKDWTGTKTDPVDAEGYASSLNGDMSSAFSDLFSSLTGVNYEETNQIHLRAISGLKAVSILNNKGDKVEDVKFEKLPQAISIYPKSFDSKDVITDYLDKWNSDETLTIDGIEILAKDRDQLTYTDTIQLIVTVINTLIDAITIALVAFSSLSLVVSCFMIAVITYISVVERIKEIGVIRSLGGRKGDVASLFVMETLFTGLFSGLFGIAMTYLFQIIFNIALTAEFGIAIANLTPLTAIIMILVSVTLSVVSGLIPSQSAAHKDPVVALRSND